MANATAVQASPEEKKALLKIWDFLNTKYKQFEGKPDGHSKQMQKETMNIQGRILAAINKPSDIQVVLKDTAFLMQKMGITPEKSLAVIQGAGFSEGVAKKALADAGITIKPTAVVQNPEPAAEQEPEREEEVVHVSAVAQASSEKEKVRKAIPALEAIRPRVSEGEQDRVDKLLRDARKISGKENLTAKDVDKFFGETAKQLMIAGLSSAQAKQLLVDCGYADEKAEGIVSSVEDKAKKQLATIKHLKKPGRSRLSQSLDDNFESVSPFFEPKYMLRHEKLGESSNAALVEVTPWAWEQIAEHVRKELGINDIKAKDPTQRSQEEKELLALHEVIFSSEESYRMYLSQPDRRKYLEDMLKGQGVVVTGGAVIQVATTSIPRFMAAMQSMKFTLDDKYDEILGSDMSDTAKNLFKQQFMTLYMANQDLGEAYLLAVYTGVVYTRAGGDQKKVDTYQKMFKQQLDMAAQWGGSMRNYLGALQMSMGGMDAQEAYMQVLYTNLCMGSMLTAQGEDKPTRVQFGRAFAIGLLGSISKMSGETITQNINRLARYVTEESDAAIKKREGEEGVPAAEKYSFERPVSAMIAMGAGLAGDVLGTVDTLLKSSILYPVVYFYAKLCQEISTDVLATFLSGAQDDEFSVYREPRVNTAMFGLVAMYASNMQGVRGIKNVTLATLMSPTTSVPDKLQLAEQAAAGVDIIDENMVDFFKEMIKFNDPKAYKNPEDFYKACLAIHAVLYSYKVNPLQEDEITGWQRAFGYPDIDEGVIKYFRKLDVEKAEQLFLMIVKIGKRGLQKPLNELMKMYEDGYKANNGNKYKGIEALEKYYEDNEGKTAMLKPRRRKEGGSAAA